MDEPGPASGGQLTPNELSDLITTKLNSHQHDRPLLRLDPEHTAETEDYVTICLVAIKVRYEAQQGIRAVSTILFIFCKQTSPSSKLFKRSALQSHRRLIFLVWKGK